jgi:peptide/nickel transport system permease protein
VWPTVLLLGTATTLSAVIGIAIGIKGGWKRGSTFDRSSTALTLTLYSMPEFWLGMVLLILFSTGVGPFPGIFPSGGTLTPGVDQWSLEGILDQLWHLFLPAVTLTLAYLAEYSLVTRWSLVDELGQDYLTTARAKGLMDRLVRRRHAVPNALLPTITLVFLNIGFIVSGAITVADIVVAAVDPRVRT